MKTILNTIIFLMLATAVLAVFNISLYGSSADSMVRVLIADDREGLDLSLKGRYRICALNTGAVLMNGPFLSAGVTATKNGLLIGSKEVNVSGVNVKVSQDSNIYVDDRRFRGEIDIIKKDNGKIFAVNHIPLDEYLYGVLYHEVSHYWPMEVLKAQAIAARTFAVYQIQQNKVQAYDLRSDIYSQMYGGRTSEKWSTTRAVNLTRGKVLKYKGGVLPAYYHATCAGHTEDAANLWNVDLAPLKGVACDFCKDSPHYSWNKIIRLPDLAARLRNGGYKIGDIVTVSILSKNISGRVDRLEIKDAAGSTIVLNGKDFRQMIGPNELRSTKFNVAVRGTDLVLDGLGWGHGVGMCQWGAYGMAREGKKCDEILKYYYPGAEIADL